MIGLIKNEMLKLLYNKKLYGFILVILAVNLLPVLISLSVRMNTTNGQVFPLSTYGVIVAFILPIFLIILIAEMFTDELTSGTLSLSLVHPVTRFQVLTAKVVHLFLFILFVLLFCLLFGYGFGTAIFGWGSEFMQRGMVYSTTQGIQITIATYLSSILPLFSFSLFVMFIAFILQGSAAVVGVSTGVYFLSILSEMLIDFPILPVTAYFNTLSYVLAAISAPNSALLHILLNVGFGLLFYLLTLWIFHRKDMVH